MVLGNRKPQLIYLHIDKQKNASFCLPQKHFLPSERREHLKVSINGLDRRKFAEIAHIGLLPRNELCTWLNGAGFGLLLVPATLTTPTA